MLTPNNDDDDSGNETDATILDEDYDSETERAFNAKNRKRKYPRHPPHPHPNQ